MENYVVTLGYKAVYMPYYGQDGYLYPGHHGWDFVTTYGADLNQPVELDDGTVLGLMGMTGTADGVHCHVDKSIDGTTKYSSYRSPSDWHTLKGTVIFAGYAGSAGNMVKIQADSGHIYRFLHFNKINVQVGQRVGDGQMALVDEEIELEHRIALGRGSTAEERRNWRGKDSLLLTKGLWGNKWVQQRIKDANNFPAMKKSRDDLLVTNKALNTENAELKAQIATGSSEDTELLNGFGELLRKLIARLGVK